MKKKTSQGKAFELIDQKILQFQDILAKATFEKMYDESYELAYHGTETLLTELFSKEEAMEFRRNVTLPMVVVGGEEDHAKELQDYKDHVGSCIAQLKVYRERVQNFWGTDELTTMAKPAQVRVANEKRSAVTRKKKYWTLGNVISLIIVVVILTLLYSPTIISLVWPSPQPSKIELSLVPNQYGYGYTHNDLRTYGAGMTGVPGYAANIYVSFQSENVEIGGAVNFHVEIANLGNSLTKPYFYAFLVNNTGNVVSAFPEVVGLYTYSKLPSWVVSSQGGIDYWYPLGESNLLIPRQTLIAGRGDYWNNSAHESGEIWLQSQIADDPSQIGKWELWIFVCDETYQTSSGTVLSTENAITYTTLFFDVAPKAPPETPNNFPTSWLWASRGASAGFVILSAFGLFKRLSPWIDSHSSQTLGWWKRNRLIVIGCVLLLIFYLILFFLGA